MTARNARVRRYVVAFAFAVLHAGPSAGQDNLDFEVASDGWPAGWEAFGRGDTGDADVALDGTLALSGLHSLRIVRTSSGTTRLAQRLAPERHGSEPRRVRLSGAVRGASAASLWLRVALPGAILFVDSRGDGRESDSAAGAAETGDANEWRRFSLDLPLPAEATELAYGVALRGQGSAWFDDLRLERTGLSSLPPPSAVARRYVEDALGLLATHALGRPSGGWTELRRTALDYARGAQSMADAHLAVRYAVAALGDRHSYFQTPRATAALRSVAVANARTGQELVAPQAAAVGEGVAYLAVPGFAGGTPVAQVEFAESIKKLIQLYDPEARCGWVVDLRQNGGGNLWPMLAGLGPLLGDGPLGASVYPDGRRVEVWYADGKAGFGDYVQLRVNDPYVPARVPAVAVLTGAGTGSSAEVLALAFRGRDDSRSFGAPTAGISTGTRTFPLADEAALVLAVAATSDRHGNVYAGPLPPDEALPASVAGNPHEDLLVAAARGWLATRGQCSAAEL